MSVITISQAESQDEIQYVQILLSEYVAWAFSLAAGADKAPTFEGVEAELAALPGIYAPPAGRLLIAKHDGQIAGCVCLKSRGSGTCEVKRLYVHPDKRGLDIGRQLVERLVDEARSAGYRRIILDSHISMTKAHAIYEAAGFKRVGAPDDFPDEIKPVAIFMECDLG